MQAPIKLHWFPMEPTWIVSLCIVILAALPHQLPVNVSFGLTRSIGILFFGLVSALVLWKKPVLGMAMFIFLASVNLSNYIEGFQNITRDRVQKTKKWAGEIIMDEEPTMIQERTDAIIVRDDVQEDDTWFGESILGETPKAIQERSTPDQPYQETEYSQDRY